MSRAAEQAQELVERLMAQRRVGLGDAGGGAGVIIVGVAELAFGNVYERLQVCEEPRGFGFGEPRGDGAESCMRRTAGRGTARTAACRQAFRRGPRRGRLARWPRSQRLARQARGPPQGRDQSERGRLAAVQ